MLNMHRTKNKQKNCVKCKTTDMAVRAGYDTEHYVQIHFKIEFDLMSFK